MKELLRKKILELRKNLSPLLKKHKDRKIQKKLERLPEFKKAKRILFYMSKEDEVDTRSLISRHLKKKHIILPRVSSQELILKEIRALADLQKGTYGIEEPKKNLPTIPYDDIDLAIIPAVAFDRLGHRIGYGKGYYDRLLKKLRSATIGLAYEFQIVDSVPIDPYDCAVSYIVTEKNVIHPKPRS